MPIESIPFNADITAVFRHFAESEHAVLLDSGKPEQQQGRYDILSAWPSDTVIIKNTGIFHADRDKNNHPIANLGALKNLLHHPSTSSTLSGNLPFLGGWIGFASYELGYWLEPVTGTTKHQSSLPAFWAGYYPWAIVQDHEKQQAFLIYEDSIDALLLKKIHQHLSSAVHYPPFRITSPFTEKQNYTDYLEKFNQAQHYINAGDCYQVNLARQYQTGFSGTAFDGYLQLRKAVPSPHMAYLNLGDEHILSISPERFIAAQGSHIHTRPIKGTAARFANPEEDRISATLLEQSPKNRAENVMIVDLLRNDLGKHCVTGSIHVDTLFTLESYHNVHHLVSSISGTMKPHATVWDVFFGCFPGGSITGAPKIRACQIINELETFPREIYCGSIFYASNNGYFDSSIAIRTLLCSNNTITAWAGGGIVKDSTADDEYLECQNKIQYLLNALETHS